MNSSGLLARRGVIYALLGVGILTLAAINFWAWLFVRGVQGQIRDQLTRQVKQLSQTYALLIGERYLLQDVFALPENSVEVIALQQMLFQFKENADLEGIFLISPDRSTYISDRISPAEEEALRRFPLNDSLFYQAALGMQPEADFVQFGEEYFLTTYTPVFDITDAVVGVLVVEAPARLFSILGFIGNTLLYVGLGGVGLIGLFAAIIVLAIRRLFRIEAQLHQQSRLAHLGQMAAMVAHEIRNPLSIIKGSADVLRKKYASEQNELFDFIPDEIDRLNRLVNDFLQFARRRELRLEPVDVAEQLQVLVGQMNDPRIHLEIPEALPPVRLDRDAFQQVMLNIVENARQAITPEGRIHIRATLVSRRPRSLTLEVIDDGCGMSPETLEKIFEPFFSTRATGSGLGMAITRQLVEQMNGTITVSSEENHGTTVKLEFPLS